MSNVRKPRGSVLLLPVPFHETVLAELAKSYIALDTETTGLDCAAGRIIEIGAIRYENGRPVRGFQSLLNPHVRCPKEATAIHHITNAMIAAAPDEAVIIEKFCRFLNETGALEGKTLLAAHNAGFDMRFLKETLERLGFCGTLRYFDTVSASRKLLPHLKSHSLSSLEHYYGLHNEKAHRALADAKVCGDVIAIWLRAQPAPLLGVRIFDGGEIYKERKAAEMVLHFLKAKGHPVESLQIYAVTNGAALGKERPVLWIRSIRSQGCLVFPFAHRRPDLADAVRAEGGKAACRFLFEREAQLESVYPDLCALLALF